MRFGDIFCENSFQGGYMNKKRWDLRIQFPHQLAGEQYDNVSEFQYKSDSLKGSLQLMGISFVTPDGHYHECYGYEAIHTILRANGVV
jgi:hypothetical protein